MESRTSGFESWQIYAKTLNYVALRFDFESLNVFNWTNKAICKLETG